MQSEDLASDAFNHGKKKYHFDLKKDSNGKIYVKLSELSNSKRSIILVGLESGGGDMTTFLANMSKAHLAAKSKEKYATQTMIMFPTKTLNMSVIENKYGSSLCLNEVDSETGMTVQFFIDMNVVDIFMSKVKSVLKTNPENT
jgi:hypothetical protein